MPNYNSFGSINVNTITSSEIASSEGKIYAITSAVKNLNQNQELGIYIGNPNGSDTSLNILTICVGSSMEATMDIILDGSLSDTKDGDITPYNLNTDYTDSSVTTVSYLVKTNANPTTGGNTLGSFSQASGVTIYPCNGSVKIDSNHSLALRIKNMHGTVGVNYIAVNVIYMES
ncbi:hypothetical protein [Marinisporobacter balticus]|uniref:Uncharacterized protein n=1 Tax=Marinisporobacter balticus TaxID=2018667 RepID=A0A4R2KLM7_9FIRM|nr:hypothetical protein [Marinisporobacter balticus]TCO74951.1 hypothetical protein EV214_11022 [Marinisporobacter balticus]